MIEAEKAHYKIAWMCRLLRVPRSSFYAWLTRTETPTAARRRELAVEVARVFTFGRGAFGCRRVASQLNREGHECSVGLVADLMRQLGLAAVQPRAYKRTTTRGEDPQHSPDLIGRDFTAGPAGGAQARGWSATSPTSRPVRGGCIWRPLSTCRPGWWWAGSWPITCAPR